MIHVALEILFLMIELCRYKGNQKISPSDKFEIKQDGRKYSLIIKDLDDSDISDYRIVAGPHSSTASLKVFSGDMLCIIILFKNLARDCCCL